ncbi:protein O-mannosyl-transferase family [Chitinophagaceae bacterium MMS25-I14]
MNYKKINNVTGWLVFAIALAVYLLTMERTVSFWDCGEFLACAYKLEVGHSPGAPFFMMMQRIFGLLAGGNKQIVAACINSESALASAFTILFLFWTITRLAYRLLIKEDKPTPQQVILIMGCGAVGALAYTFSDTFWFSAVEAEVYATSSCFTALVFWAILKWEAVADTRYADRWLVLISFLIGISVGIHLLNLLTIPALAMVYYFRRYKTTKPGIVAAFFIGCALLALVQFGVIQYLSIFASRMDLFFVNSLGLPFDSGALFFVLLLVAALTVLLLYARRKNNYLLHTGILSLMFIIIGFSSYIVPMIRSRADVPVDMTNPDNVMSLVSYVQREQYLQQPIAYGPDYNTPVTGLDDKGDSYSQVKKDGKDHYEVTDHKFGYKYDPSRMRFFPRIWDNSDPGHVQYYQNFLGLSQDDVPSTADNLSFFWGYQLNWMWWRYFMWNYAGRQNDYEGQMEARNGNWVSGIKPWDKARVGDMDDMANGYAHNKARNELYCLPLILGILGMVYQFNRNRKDALIVTLLFFFTGIAIAIYLNMAAIQPRERDYAFAGSTYAFAIWIGIGVLMVQQWMQKLTKKTSAVYLTIVLCLLAVPTLMAKEEWDDHDRSAKSLARATAYNTLMSCAPNAVLFTVGDNDTYPLWYLQEVEGIRRDVRVVITELLGTDWYIDQLNYRVNDADAVPMIWKKDDYIGGHHNYVNYLAAPGVSQDKYFNLEEVCRFITSNDPANKQPNNTGETENYLPAKKFFVQGLPVQQLISNGWVSPSDTTRLDNTMKFEFPKQTAFKNDLAIMNIIAAVARDGWKRPLYFNGSFPGNDNTLGMGNYMYMEGIAYRLLPFSLQHRSTDGDKGSVNLDKSYDLFMKQYIWGGGERKDVYFDEKNRVMFVAYKLNGTRLANALADAGRLQDAIHILDKLTASISAASYPHDFTSAYIVQAYYHANAVDKGRVLSQTVAQNAETDLKWIRELDESKQASEINNARNDLGQLNVMLTAAQSAGDSATAKNLSVRLQQNYNSVVGLVNTQGN